MAEVWVLWQGLGLWFHLHMVLHLFCQPSPCSEHSQTFPPLSKREAGRFSSFALRKPGSHHLALNLDLKHAVAPGKDGERMRQGGYGAAAALLSLIPHVPGFPRAAWESHKDSASWAKPSHVWTHQQPQLCCNKQESDCSPELEVSWAWDTEAGQRKETSGCLFSKSDFRVSVQ